MQTVSSALDSMGDMELCPSLDTDINLIGCINGMFQHTHDKMAYFKDHTGIADIVELAVDPRGSLESGEYLENPSICIHHNVRQDQNWRFRPMSLSTSIDQVSTNINSHSEYVNIYPLKYISNMLENG